MSLELEDVLRVLEEALDTDLHIDGNQACKILLNDKISIQLELDKSGQYLLLGSQIIELPPGKFRENVLKAAMKANYGREKGFGSLAYLPKSAQLCIFEFIPLNFLAESQIFDLFAQFSSKALLWKENLENSQIPISNSSSFSPLNPFGIK
jgi:hypothetical protein